MTTNGGVMKQIAIGADHRGFVLKEFLVHCHRVREHTITWIDVGTNSSESADYPAYAFKVVHKVRTGEADMGILLCGTGLGMSIAANRFKKIYAALAWNAEIARRARQEDGANILVLPADYLASEQVLEIVSVWLSSSFLGGHYQKRLHEVDMF